MACKECKKKGELKDEVLKSGEFIGKGVIVFAIAWTLLGLYGLITLISKVI